MPTPPRILFLLLTLLSAASCTEDLEMAPAFVLVEEFDLVTPELGESTSAISEVWAFADNQFVGAFDLPARIPIFAAGETEVRLQAGVRRNGISATPDPYEFYEPAIRTVELIPGETIDFGRLTIGYRPNVRFGFIEDFEPDNERVFVNRLVGTQGILPQSEVVRSGEASGKFTLNRDSPRLELSSNAELGNLFENRAYVWLEVDFFAESPVAWGAIGLVDGVEVKPLDPTSVPRGEWTKIYFDLTEIIATSRLDDLEIYFSSVLFGGGEDEEVYLDNIRLLYF